ncbi:ras-related protein Rab-13-like [Xenia sp. Carnegie-2017]|uniref:ras-related protein Rab-13-like n=1 Tax=Xenia sp. Carnegie-2017 TaxID=2897299 RepID=UPI001F049760|nr:ras-related protein Rab-13-like [Xenia sp. Carnegie-2017]
MADNVEMNVHKNTSDFKRPIKPYKVAFAGVYSVGKTSLFRRINGQYFTEEKPPSQENSTYDLIFPEENVVIPLKFWDTQDMERHDSVTQSYYRGSVFILLVYSVDNDSSLDDIPSIIDNIKRDEPTAKLLLLKNKIDLPKDEWILMDKEETVLRRTNDKIYKKFSTSAKTKEGIDTLMEALKKSSLQLFKRAESGHEDIKDLLSNRDKITKDKKSYQCCS